MNNLDIKKYSDFVGEVCRKNDWEKDWSHGGCYMHLEVSEFIESLRGKGDPIEELGDVIFTIVAVAGNYGIKISDAIENSIAKHSEVFYG